MQTWKRILDATSVVPSSYVKNTWKNTGRHTSSTTPVSSYFRLFLFLLLPLFHLYLLLFFVFFHPHFIFRCETHLFKRVCLSLGPSHTSWIIWTEKHQEWESMLFKRQFKDKYAGNLPERICCPNSVRYLFLHFPLFHFVYIGLEGIFCQPIALSTPFTITSTSFFHICTRQCNFNVISM